MIFSACLHVYFAVYMFLLLFTALLLELTHASFVLSSCWIFFLCRTLGDFRDDFSVSRRCTSSVDSLGWAFFFYYTYVFSLLSLGCIVVAMCWACFAFCTLFLMLYCTLMMDY